MTKRIIFFSLFPLLGFADVNMRDASFIRTENDFTNQAFERTYNSRSLWRGIFGFGWCADFEKSLESRSPSENHLRSCNHIQKVTVHLRGHERHFLDQKKNLYVFNLSGKLIRIESPGQKHRFFSYDMKGRLSALATPSSKFRFVYDNKENSLREIQEIGRRVSIYKFKNENLISVLDSQGRKTHYKYDSFNNLTQIQIAGSLEKIVYRADLDEVRAHFGSNGCYDLFQFQKINELVLKSSVHNRCPFSPARTKVYSFISKRSPRGDLILTQVKTAGGPNDFTVLP